MNIIRRHIQFITRALDKMVPRLPIYEVTDGRTACQIAELVRNQWNILEVNIENLTTVLEIQGIIISSFDFGTERVDSKVKMTHDK